MKLHEEFKLFEEMWDGTLAKLTETSTVPMKDVEANSEEALSACLARISNSARRRPRFDPYDAPIVGEVYVTLSRSDLEKALKIGDSGLWTGRGTSAPAELVNRVDLLFWYAVDNMNAHVSLELCGDENEIAKYFEDEIRVGDIDIAQHFQSYEEAENYFNTKIVPKANQLASQIINNSWEKYGFGKDLQEAVANDHYADALDMFMRGHKTKMAATKFWLSEIIELDIADDDAVTNELRLLLADKYVLQHIADMLVLRRIRKNQTLNDIATGDTIENIQAHGLEGDFMVELLNEILDIYNNYKAFTKTSLGESTSTKTYDLELTAWGKDEYDEYDDADNIGDLTYQFSGALPEIINKLNTIAKTHKFSFVFIFDGDNCVFEASDTNSGTDEELDVPVVWNNEIIPANTPFLKAFKKAPNN